MKSTFWPVCVLFVTLSTGSNAETLPGTEPLNISDDIASNLVAGADRFLLKKIEQAAIRCINDLKTAVSIGTELNEQRQKLRAMLGLLDPPVQFEELELLSTVDQPAKIGRGDGFDVFAVRWPAFADVYGEGLLLRPVNTEPWASIIVVPDCEQTPEQLAGLASGLPQESQVARRLAENGCEVIVPALLDRNFGPHKGRARITAREFIHRSAYVLGRTMTGYEVQKLLALIEWHRRNKRRPLGIFGYGEGGRLTLFTAALIGEPLPACVSGYFDDRSNLWQEPIDRNVFGLLEHFGDAGLACMAGRRLLIEAARGLEAEFTGQGGGAPSRLVSPTLESVQKELKQAAEILRRPTTDMLAISGNGQGPFGTDKTLERFLHVVSSESTRRLRPIGAPPQLLAATNIAKNRQARMFHELDRHNQWLLTESPYVRANFMKQLDTSSIENYQKSAEKYRQLFYTQIIGKFDDKLLPPRPRTRKTWDFPKWSGYEVLLDVFPDILAYGVLLLPKDIRPDERRPVIVCQHGLEGRPTDTFLNNNPAYHDFAAKLAERGFITFAPQNLYLFKDRFRTLQRKANTLGKTLFSIITPQHEQILNWLAQQPFVDPERIAFYGLSYGGKTAMRVPAILTNYCLSICSADFNDWVWKNASSRSPYSYVWTGEYEIFEFNLGQTFNYAEMAALIAPRPFMVERGHFDGVAPDETVAYEFAKVRHLYAARLKLPDRAQIEWFAGPHTINGKGTFDFLHKHLKWPAPNQ